MNVNNQEINDIYKNLKVMLSGCKHISDAYDIGNLFIKKYPQHKNPINSIINGKKNHKRFDLTLIERNNNINETIERI